MPLLLLCSSCHEPIAPPESPSECQHGDCDRPICAKCRDTFYRRYCTDHQLPPYERLLDVRRRYEEGKFPLLIEQDTARARQRRCLDRFNSRIHSLRRIPHPFLGRRYPRRQCNVVLEQFPAIGGRQQSVGLAFTRCFISFSFRPNTMIWEMRVVGRKEAFDRDGFDTYPLKRKELNAHIRTVTDELGGRGNNCVSVTALASVTGWSDDVVEEWIRQGGYDHSALLLFLVDLHRPALIYHWHDLDSRQRALIDEIAEVFSPPDELTTAMDRIKEYLETRSAVELVDATSVLKIRRPLALKAFDRLCQEDFRILQPDPSDPSNRILVKGKLQGR